MYSLIYLPDLFPLLCSRCAGQMTYGTALGAYNYLWAESEFVPWAAAIDNLAYLKEMFARTGGYGALKARHFILFYRIFFYGL